MTHRGRLRLAVLSGVLAAAAAGAATPYYVSPSGSDDDLGTSRKRAWRTIDRVNAADLEPGDRVLFRGGATFAGTLRLTEEDGGTPDRPVLIGSYGPGRATIDAGRDAGIVVYNVAGIVIRRLEIAGAGRDGGNRSDGISFYTDVPVPGSRLDTVRVDSVDVHGFGGTGLVLGGYAWDTARGAGIKTGFRNVLFRRVTAHDNADAGIASYGTFDPTLAGHAHANVTIRRCRAFRNPGIPGKSGNSGNGIVLSDVDGGTVEWSVAHENGERNDLAGGGPVGIWAWDSNRIVIRHNESFRNRSATIDGGGFDLDGGCTGCRLEHNLSQENGGTGFLVYHFWGARPTRDNVVRANVSRNDGRRNGGGLDMGGGAEGTLFERNRVRIGPRPVASQDGPFAAGIVPDGLTNVDTTFRDNEFLATGGVPLLDIPDPPLQAGLRLDDNGYETRGDPVAIRWGDTVYSDLDAWRTATGQEP